MSACKREEFTVENMTKDADMIFMVYSKGVSN